MVCRLLQGNRGRIRSIRLTHCITYSNEIHSRKNRTPYDLAAATVVTAAATAAVTAAAIAVAVAMHILGVLWMEFAQAS